MTIAEQLLGLHPTHNRYRWTIAVGAAQSSFSGNLFGGVALGAAIAAIERVTGRPCVWATAQFLAFAPRGATVDLDVREVAVGRAVSQVRAVGHIEDDEIFTVNAACGARASFTDTGEFAVRPDVPSPDECPPRESRLPNGGSLFGAVDVRIAHGRQYGDLDGTPADRGRSALWARYPDLASSTEVPLLAVLGDFVPSGIGQALGTRSGGSSLDNTIRVVRRVPSEWVLLDIRVHSVVGGFGHGLVHQWSEDGQLLATCSQSVIARNHARPES